MSSYVFSEPMPSIASSGLSHSGRGGAGNVRPSAIQATQPINITITKPTGRFYTGIGGAGNVHAASERKTMSFDEDFERAKARENLSVSHCGIGGAGNVYRRDSAVSTKSTSSRQGSESSFWRRLSSSSFGRN